MGIISNFSSAGFYPNLFFQVKEVFGQMYHRITKIAIAIIKK